MEGRDHVHVGNQVHQKRQGQIGCGSFSGWHWSLGRRVGANGVRSRVPARSKREGDETRQLALDLGFIPVVPPKQNRLTPWEYNRAMYKRRNEIERLFRRLKGFQRIFSRFDKLDVMFLAFINFALIVDGLS